MADNSEFIAAALSRMKAQQDGMERLFKAVESGIADIADPTRMRGVERALAAIEAGVADAVEALGKRDDRALDRIAAAVSAIRMPNVELAPVFNVPQAPAQAINVEAPSVTVEAVMPSQPAPIVNNEIHLPEQTGAAWKVTLHGQHGAPARVMTIERIT